MSAASAKRKALIILPEAAYPVAGGGPLRTACILEFLASRFELDAIHFRLSGDPDPFALYPKAMIARRAVIDLPLHSKAFLPRLLRNLLRGLRGVPPLVDRFSGQNTPIAAFLDGQHYDLAWCEHFWTAPYAPLLRPHAKKMVLDLHNIESEYFRLAGQVAKPSESWLWRRFHQVALATERKLIPQFDIALTTSQADASRIQHAQPRQVAVIPNTIPSQTPPPVQPTHSIAFSGNFAYTPNFDGMRWFVKSVWSRLFLTHPALSLRVIGKEAELVRPLFTSLERVDIVGPVANAVEEIAKSQIAVAPLLVGSGTRLKILEAWAAGAAVVSTPLGAEGLDAQPGVHLEIADTPQSFALHIDELLQNETKRRKIIDAARNLLEARFTWRRAHNLLADLEL
jgi:glycosyltransferase involved in cell wall biosynthesis